MIDPARPIPAMIDYVALAPVKVHAQPAPDCQTKTVGDEGWRARGPTFFIHNGSVILGNVHILWLSRDNLDVVPVDNDLLFIVALQIAVVSGLPPQPLDRSRHIFRLVEKGISEIGNPVQIPGHHFKNVRIVGNCLDRFIPTLSVDA
jgi:hypothetical protein